MNKMIDSEKLYTYFNTHLGPLTPSTNNYYSCTCPICGKKDKLAVNFIYKTARCFRGCFSGFAVDIIMIYNGISYFEAYELIDSMEPGLLRVPCTVNKAQKSSIQLPRGFHLILEGNTNMAHRARTYLQDRNFDLNYMDRLGVGYCIDEDKDPLNNFFGRIIIPFKRNGVLIYFIGRTFIDDYQRYKNPPASKNIGKSEVLFNEEALFIQKKVYLFEGWADASTIGPTGVSQQGALPGLIQRNIIIKSPIEELILVPDAGFYSNGLAAARDLMKHKKVKVLNLDYYQEMGIGKDANELGKETIYNQEEKTQWMDDKFLFHQFKVYANKRIVI